MRTSGLPAVVVAAFTFQAGVALAQTEGVPTRIYTHVFATDGLSESNRLSLETAIAAGGRLGASPPEIVTLAPPSRPAAALASQDLSRADRAADLASEQFANLELPEAKRGLWKAIRLYLQHLWALVARDGSSHRLRDAYVALVSIEFLSGDQEAARQALSRAFALDPKLTYSAQAFPPQLEEFVRQQRRVFLEAKRGTLAIRVANGEGAVFVNGVERGASPLVLDGLPIGHTTVSVLAPGARPAQAHTTVIAGQRRKVLLSFPARPSANKGPLRRFAPPDDVKALLSEALVTVALELDVGALMLVAVKPRDRRLEIRGFLYQVSTRRLVAYRRVWIDRVDVGRQGRTFGEVLLARAVWRVTLSGGAQKTRARQTWKPWRHRYFWPAVGTVTGAVLLGIVVSAASGMSPGKRLTALPITRY